MPELQFDGARPPASSFFNIGPQFWKFPKNGQELVEAVRWAARDELPVQVSGPSSLIANLVEQSERKLLCLHLVNYDSRGMKAENVEVRLRLPAGATVNQVKLISPNAEGSQTLPARMDGAEALFSVPDARQYSVVVVNY
jgi:UDP-N-acetylenolpyruvoylglucosamine reductase